MNFKTTKGHALPVSILLLVFIILNFSLIKEQTINIFQAQGIFDRGFLSFLNAGGASAQAEEEILYSEDFSSSSLEGYLLVDEGDISAPSNWTIQGGEVVQSSNIFSFSTLQYPGTYIYYEPGLSWTDYEINFRMKSTDNDGVGLMFRYINQDNYYRFSWHREGSHRRLVKKANGVFTIQASDNVAYTSGQWYNVKIEAIGSELKVYVDGTLILSAVDNTMGSGTFALYSWGNTGAYFDDIKIINKSGSTPPLPAGDY